jgi:hypothetical protein
MNVANDNIRQLTVPPKELAAVFGGQLMVYGVFYQSAVLNYFHLSDFSPTSWEDYLSAAFSQPFLILCALIADIFLFAWFASRVHSERAEKATRQGAVIDQSEQNFQPVTHVESSKEPIHTQTQPATPDPTCNEGENQSKWMQKVVAGISQMVVATGKKLKYVFTKLLEALLLSLVMLFLLASAVFAAHGFEGFVRICERLAQEFTWTLLLAQLALFYVVLAMLHVLIDINAWVIAAVVFVATLPIPWLAASGRIGDIVNAPPEADVAVFRTNGEELKSLVPVASNTNYSFFYGRPPTESQDVSDTTETNTSSLQQNGGRNRRTSNSRWRSWFPERGKLSGLAIPTNHIAMILPAEDRVKVSSTRIIEKPNRNGSQAFLFEIIGHGFDTSNPPTLFLRPPQAASSARFPIAWHEISENALNGLLPHRLKEGEYDIELEHDGTLLLTTGNLKLFKMANGQIAIGGPKISNLQERQGPFTTHPKSVQGKEPIGDTPASSTSKTLSVEIDVKNEDLTTFGQLLKEAMNEQSWRQPFFNAILNYSPESPRQLSIALDRPIEPMRRLLSQCYFLWGRKEYKANRYQSAICCLDQGVLFFAEDARYYYLRAVARRNCGDGSGAARDVALAKIALKARAVSKRDQRAFRDALRPHDLNWLRTCAKSLKFDDVKSSRVESNITRRRS